MKQFGIEDTDVVYSADNEEDYAQDNYYIDFKPREEDGNTKVYGDVLVELGKDGRLISISDNRIWYEYVKKVQCIFMSDSIRMAQEVGCGNWQGKAVVESVEESYSFISETGYLIPTW